MQAVKVPSSTVSILVLMFSAFIFLEINLYIVFYLQKIPTVMLKEHSHEITSNDNLLYVYKSTPYSATVKEASF